MIQILFMCLLKMNYTYIQLHLGATDKLTETNNCTLKFCCTFVPIRKVAAYAVHKSLTITYGVGWVVGGFPNLQNEIHLSLCFDRGNMPVYMHEEDRSAIYDQISLVGCPANAYAKLYFF